MFRIFCFLTLTFYPLINFSQDLKFELLAKWESLTPEFPVGFGSSSNAIDIFNIGDFNNDGVPDVGFRTSNSQWNPIIWNKTLGGINNDEANLIEQTFDGGFIVVGSTQNNDGDITDGNNGVYDCWIIKLDSAGNKLWDRTLGGSKGDRASSIQQTSDGGFIVAGRTESNDEDISDGNNGDTDIWIVKLDEFGNKIWDKTLGGSKGDDANSIQQTSDGGFIVAGSTNSEDGDVSDGNNGLSDYWIIKLDEIGNKIWDKTLGGSDNDWIRSIDQTSDGGYILSGITNSNDGDISYGYNGMGLFWVVKLDEIGNKIWSKALGGFGVDHANSIQQTSDGGYIVAGQTTSNDGDINDGNNGGADIWIVKLDEIGDKIWDKTLGGSSIEFANSIQQTSDGGYIVAAASSSSDGDISSANNGNWDFWIIKLDSSGNKLWDEIIGGSDNETPKSILQTQEGDYIIVGSTGSSDGDISDGNNGGEDIWIVKLNKYPYPCDSLYILALNKNGSVNHLYPLVPGISGFNHLGERSSGWAGFGAGLVNMGDMDENGVNDFLISSPSEKPNDSIEGGFFVLFMNPDASVKSFNFLDKSEIMNSQSVGGEPSNFTGFSMTSIGDLDNDGINEVAVNSHEVFSNGLSPDTSEIGGLYVLFFNSDGTLKKSTLSTFLSFRQIQPLDVYGGGGTYAIENAGDLDSNGVNDVLMDHFSAGISIFYLDNDGNAIDLKQIHRSNSKITENDNSLFGTTISSVPDINNDGNNEIVSQFVTPMFGERSVFTSGIIYYNDSFSISNIELINPYDIDGVEIDPSIGESFGNRSVYLGDINSDGYPELGIVDMYKNNQTGNYGMVYIVSIKPADCLETTCIWPGDANNDGVANCEDALSIGRGFNKLSEANKRILPVNRWIAQEAGDWGELNDNIDMKFSDCDGNGRINKDDLNAVRQNYNLTHQKRNTIEFEDNGPVLRIVPSQQNAVGNDTAKFDILLGDKIKNAENIFGLNITVKPSSPKLYESSIKVDYSDSWIGNIDSNAIHLEHQLSDGISFSIVRTDHQNTTNSGKIARIKIPLPNDIDELGKFTFEVTDLNIESHEGDAVLVSEIVSDSISIVNSAVLISSLNHISQITCYPNPTSGRVYFNLEDEISQVIVYSSIGFGIKKETVNARAFNLDLSDLSEGTYFIFLQGKNHSYQNTITVKK